MKKDFAYKNISMLALLCVGALSYAANLTNSITGVGGTSTMVSPYFCIQNSNGTVTYQLDPGKTVDNPNQYSGNDYYVGGALRFNSAADPSDPNFDLKKQACDAKNTYLGYLGLSFNNKDTTNNKVSSYQAPVGVHIAYVNPTLNANGALVGAIEYTPIAYNANLNQPVNHSPWLFAGINLSGFEFDKVINPVTAPNLSEADKATSYTDLEATQTFIQEGANTIRFPLDWGYLQPEGAGKGEIYANYFDNYVKPALESTTHAKVYTIVDLHAYMHYPIFGKQYAGCGEVGACPDGTMITDSAPYVDVWTKLYDLLANDSKIDMNYIMFDLINEPVLDDTAAENAPESPFTVQVDTIKALRDRGYQGYILVEGNAWSGLHSWTTETWGSGYTNATLFTRERFEKAGVDLSKIFINAHQYFDVDYSGTHSNCQTDLSTTGPTGFNLQAFVDYLKTNQFRAIVTEFGGGTDQTTCSIALTKFLDYVQTNATTSDNSGFVGWTVWSTGHGWGNYNLRVTPTSYQWETIRPYLTSNISTRLR